MLKLIVPFALVIVSIAAAGRAQDRMPPLAAGALTEAQKKAIAEFKAARSVDISGPFVPLLRSPEVMNRARALGDYLRYKSSLPPRLSEFVILLTARRWTQQYEWNAHYPAAIQAGLVPVSLGLIAASALILARVTDHNVYAAVITAVTALVTFTTRINPLWVFAAGALLGLSGWL